MINKGLCTTRVITRIGGLTEGLSYKVRKMLNCDVIVKVSCEHEDFTIKGELISVFTEAVELKVEVNKDRKFILIPLSKINNIKKLCKNC
jgi:uncharacterized protein YifN (PemK superfamily)